MTAIQEEQRMLEVLKRRNQEDNDQTARMYKWLWEQHDRKVKKEKALREECYRSNIS